MLFDIQDESNENPSGKYLASDAVFSSDRIYRYQLRRVWDSTLPTIAFVGLNPSTATETEDDPTIRRCVGFAKSWGYGSLLMLNLFAFRATDPFDMKQASDPVGPENDHHLKTIASSHKTICAWGTIGKFNDRAKQVLTMLVDVELFCLKLTKAGFPSHPLYLPKDLQPIIYRSNGK